MANHFTRESQRDIAFILHNVLKDLDYRTKNEIVYQASKLIERRNGRTAEVFDDRIKSLEIRDI